jgi:hypothetical protein
MSIVQLIEFGFCRIPSFRVLICMYICILESEHIYNILFKFFCLLHRIIDELIDEVTREYQDANSDKKGDK